MLAAALVWAVASALAASPAAAGNNCPTMITKCGCTIGSAGKYTVANALTQSAANGDCIDINANNVSLNTQGFNITGPGASSNGVGVKIVGDSADDVVTFSNMSNDTVFSIISGFKTGIEVDGNFAVLENFQTSNNAGAGVLLNAAQSALVDNFNSLNNGGNGIELDDSNNNVVDNFVSNSNSGSGLVFNDSDHASVSFFDTDSNSANGVALVNNSHNNGFTFFGTRSNAGYGLWVQASNQNLFGTFSSDSNAVGVYLGCAATGGPLGANCHPNIGASEGNEMVDVGVGSNTGDGIAIDLGDSQNIVTFAVSTSNGGTDMVDENSNCGTNRWFNNMFGTSNAGCIN